MTRARPTPSPARRWPAIVTLAALALCVPSIADAAVCYQLPFANPNLSDGWGSTCCGRTSPHRGVDFPQASGTAIPSVADGVVVVNTHSGCLGNVVVVQHADGMFSGYSHMVVPSPLGPGTEVKLGQHIGQVGATGTCAFGAHLHLTMAPTAGGYGSGTTVDPYAYIQGHLSCNDPPVGNLDTVDCEAITGWTQDPSMPDASIAAHLYFNGPAGDPAGISLATTADVPRDDLCMAIGSCNHGFVVPTPASLQDGNPHDVYAYGIDAEASGQNPVLGSSPLSLTCPPPPLTGFRRLISDPIVLTAWQFSTFADMHTTDDATLAALPQSLDLPPAPMLIRGDDGSPAVWLLDGQFGDHRRLVPSPAAATAWRFNYDTITTWPADQIALLPEAPALHPRPILVKGTGPDIFVLDENIEPLGAATSDGSAEHGDSDEGGTSPTTGATTPLTSTTDESSASSSDTTAGESEDDTGCGCTTTNTTPWLGALVLLLVRPRRRIKAAA